MEDKKGEAAYTKLWDQKKGVQDERKKSVPEKVFGHDGNSASGGGLPGKHSSRCRKNCP
jgi:hypothetical protein